MILFVQFCVNTVQMYIAHLTISPFFQRVICDLLVKRLTTLMQSSINAPVPPTVVVFVGHKEDLAKKNPNWLRLQGITHRPPDVTPAEQTKAIDAGANPQYVSVMNQFLVLGGQHYVTSWRKCGKAIQALKPMTSCELYCIPVEDLIFSKLCMYIVTVHNAIADEHLSENDIESIFRARQLIQNYEPNYIFSNHGEEKLNESSRAKEMTNPPNLQPGTVLRDSVNKITKTAPSDNDTNVAVCDLSFVA
jgi:hypothetical protein